MKDLPALPQDPTTASLTEITDACRAVWDHRDDLIGPLPLATAREGLRRAGAIEAYLEGTTGYPSAQVAARVLEAAVGAALGDPATTTGRPLPHDVKVIEAHLRHEFRRLWKYRERWEAKADPDKGMSRRAAIGLCAPARERRRKAKKRDVTERGSLDIIRGDALTVMLGMDPGSVDAIVTDPPYPRESLHLYGQLATGAAHVLKPGGMCAAMAGQSYLPEVIEQLSTALDYHWTIAYLTPGGQAVQLWERKVNTSWKPVLVFTNGEYVGDWFGDVARSRANDNDKRYHDWGQSESGMADLIDRVTQPDELVLDPFAGGRTTGVVAERMGRRFVGIEIEEDGQ